MANSVQDIANAWANWVVQQHPESKGLYKVATYQFPSDWGNLVQNQLTSAFQTMTYSTATPPVPGSVTSVITAYKNGTSLQQSITYNETETTTRQLTIAVTEGLNIGETIQVQADVPEVAKMSDTTTLQVNFSSTQTVSETKTQTWQTTYPLVIPPMSEVDATLVVSTATYNIAWTASVLLSNCVGVQFNYYVDLDGGGVTANTWTIPVQTVFAQCQQNNIIDTSGYQIVSNGVLAVASGMFTGGQGVGYSVVANQSPYNPSTNTAVVRRERREYPLSPGGMSATSSANTPES